MRLALMASMLAAATLAYGELPEHFVAAGVMHNGYARPEINVWASYAHHIAGQRMYSYSTVDITSAERIFTMQTSLRTGVAVALLEHFGPFTIWGLAEAGGAATSRNIGGSWSTGGLVTFGITRGWRALIPVRITKTALTDYQVSLGLGIGWGK